MLGHKDKRGKDIVLLVFFLDISWREGGNRGMDKIRERQEGRKKKISRMKGGNGASSKKHGDEGRQALGETGNVNSNLS